jgi:hypothetical protein
METPFNFSPSPTERAYAKVDMGEALIVMWRVKMKTTHEIKEMIKEYQTTLDKCNKLFETEGRTEQQQILSDRTDRYFDNVAEAVSEHIEKLLQDFSDIDVYIMSIDTVTQYNGDPYHSYFARVKCPSSAFMAGSVSKHIKVNGFPYRG